MTLLARIKGGLVVSCQALPGEPLHGSDHMCAMARAAAEGGAAGVLANGGDDIARIRACVELPLIGVVTREYAGSDIALTATMTEIDEIVAAGAQMAGLDATDRRRPDDDTLDAFFSRIRERYPSLLLMAEIAAVAEAIRAQEIGFDCISSAAYGYTPDTAGRRLSDHDFAHFSALRAATTRCPLVAEGGIGQPAHAARVLELGADVVVVGSAITRPQSITAAYRQAMISVSR
ncbi:N-acetylmannosamine-6-phosphate 2-epimerase [Burkholderia dolosa]|uniref:N-acetylmannosamine-6-phosphate 2-epimerase n=1 Tax=Burkholderia dolosa TaxID=152500 RepID=UPI001B9ACA2B|nr:N-acetylmannosamine-6-phosphate 2-epimerase [Burkholderia dolosa]MBR8313581.1 N-acetylmannosamine-6-phosphate 2-epimerase [Burkholderia dolosa]